MTTPHTIPESVQHPLVYIGSSPVNLRNRLSDHLRKPHLQSPAEKAAHADGVRLEVSWAKSEDADARLVKNALLQEYREERGELPNYEGVRGNKNVGPETNSPTLHWEHYVPLDESTLPNVPREPGVYRIRIAKR